MNLEKMKVVILSPHIDDAAFGLTLTISKLLDKNVPVTIVNCFTVTKWTGVYVAGDVEAISRLRKAEDVEFNKLFDSQIKIINLDLLDAPLRNGYIFQSKPFEQNEWELIEDLKRLLPEYIGDAILLCPLAIGNHIDHAICREAFIKLYKDSQVIFYEDLPYAQRITEEQIHRHISDLQEQLAVQLTPHTCAFNHNDIDKDQAIRVYKSQLNDEICAQIAGHLYALSGERIWGEEKETELFRNLFINK